MNQKKFFLTLAFVAMSLAMFSQDILGTWNGALNIQGMQLRLVFHVEKQGDEFSATMDSPDQKAFGIPTEVSFIGNKVEFSIPSIKLEYTGEIKDSEIIGTFSQMGMSMPMNLSREEVAEQKFNRPQEPKKPYPYIEEEIKFFNPKEKIYLAGTLTKPNREGKFPVVVLISGSGAQDRNEEIMQHKPFLIIADYLTRQGIAVLRYDDRGFGASEGNFEVSTTMDFATDVESAVDYLKTRKEKEKKHIGLIGHSEGGMIAPIVASRRKDIDFIILLAGTGMRGDKILLAQNELIGRASGIDEATISKNVKNYSAILDVIVNSKDDSNLKDRVETAIKELYKDDSQSLETWLQALPALISPWMKGFIRLDPTDALQKVKCPVLALGGGKDLQVPAKENLTAIKVALEKGGNKSVNTMEFPRINHLFQEANSSLPSEYALIEQTFSPEVLAKISEWIKRQL